MDEKDQLGPRGGTTTRTKSGLYRTTVSFAEDEWELLRERAFRRHTSMAYLVREAVRQYLGLED